MRCVFGGFVLAAALLAACGPQWAPLNAPAYPCPTIDEAAFNAALEAGAARGTARIHESGMVDLRFGPGVSHCATFNSSIRPCRRPNDLVIEYTVEDGSKLHVRVPANEQYRFIVRNRPHTCEIIQRNPG